MKFRRKWMGVLLVLSAVGLFGATALAQGTEIVEHPRPRHAKRGRPHAADQIPAKVNTEVQVDATALALSQQSSDDLTLLAELHEARAEHIDQGHLLALTKGGQPEEAFAEAFEAGDELFEITYNAVDGVGANVGAGSRFSQLPRADLAGLGEWATHFPKRITGPNAEACNDCHGAPFDDGAGRAANNNVRDPLHSGDLALFIQRNTPHLFGAGAVQLLAEEMTEALHALREEAIVEACAQDQPITVLLHAKEIQFGTLSVVPTAANPCSTAIDTSAVVGVDPDLVVRPFQWKGVNATVREFNRDAAHQELGMQSVETVGDGVDGDYDGVVNELTVGDQTAMAIYVAAQPRPTTLLELAELGLIEPLSPYEEAAIERGGRLFEQSGCSDCHMPQLTVEDPIFTEPSQNPNYRDARFPAGQDPVARGLDPANPIRFDLTADQPDNVITLAGDAEEGVYRLGSLAGDGEGGAIAALFGDLKRHDMGPALAESIDDEGVPSSVFLTENLWGVGSTAPYLHDGRATTLTEAILAHGGEAEETRRAFTRLEQGERGDLIAFLENLVLHKME